MRSLSTLCSFKKYLSVTDRTTPLLHDCAYLTKSQESCLIVTFHAISNQQLQRHGRNVQ
jgi:hypothetical protein